MKEFFTWSDEISVGIEEIDEQHKQLISIINRLYNAIIYTAEGQTEVVKALMEELTQYTLVHFAVEESLFRIFDYPEYEAHFRHHENLRQQVIDINEKIQRGEEQGTIDLMSFLRKWLRNHIMVEDKRYSPYLINQGIKATWANKSWIGRIWRSRE